ncbi:hypothetical protein F1737_02595 [Methanoplanus sp. FWC-SCC4]|uniref:Uncharacterized protein n=1 Tax=Methanochimaera problematica TaxID=2609417 RepID=A0AA97FAP1_9EURY|nr:hypothetical protein [Methanoplanus sp. FWC-SCC4]WOF15652.1 hypothetical protein F1737_02595 [Methanoplanus sp. FWC-SCC4]
MYETNISGKEKKHSFSETLAGIPGRINSVMPSMEKKMGRYFDSHFNELISEWDLVTLSTLDHLEHRLDGVSSEISMLESKKTIIEERARALESAISEIEGEL